MINLSAPTDRVRFFHSDFAYIAFLASKNPHALAKIRARAFC
jgi:hypothetical protein